MVDLSFDPEIPGSEHTSFTEALEDARSASGQTSPDLIGSKLAAVPAYRNLLRSCFDSSPLRGSYGSEDAERARGVGLLFVAGMLYADRQRKDNANEALQPVSSGETHPYTTSTYSIALELARSPRFTDCVAAFSVHLGELTAFQYASAHLQTILGIPDCNCLHFADCDTIDLPTAEFRFAIAELFLAGCLHSSIFGGSDLLKEFDPHPSPSFVGRSK